MQRLIEQPSDNGELLVGDASVGRVHYHLAVYQHFSDSANESVPANLEVEGRIVAPDEVDLSSMHSAGTELTLRLADGRSLEFSLVDADGRIRSTGRGLR